MKDIKKRDDAYEAKFIHDEELRFKANARRNKLLGLWAADKMSLEGDAANEYAMAVVRADFLAPGSEDVYAKIAEDFQLKGVGQSEHQIRRTMDELMDVAIKQLEGEP